MSTMNTAGAFLLGAAVGATVGVLMAPDKGTATRKNLMNKKDELKDEAKEKYEEGKDYVKNKYKEGKEKVSNLKAKAREKADEVKTDLEEEMGRNTTPDYTTAL